MFSDRKKRLETAKQRLLNPVKKKKKRKPPKVTVTLDVEEESDEEKIHIIKNIADELCQPHVSNSLVENYKFLSTPDFRETARSLIL